MLDPNPTALRGLTGPDMLRRTFDAAEVNPILNHESVFPFVSLPGFTSLDVAPLLEEKDQFGNFKNVALMGDRGCILFFQLEPGIYEVHTNFIRLQKSARAPHYIFDACKAAARWMFTRTDAMTLQTRVPAFNRVARLAIPRCGFQLQFERKEIYPHKNDLVAVTFWALTYERWFQITDELIETGREFHRRLEREFARHEVSHRVHRDEDIHDRAVGGCCEMIFAGQMLKGVVLYNRWARFAGYRPIELIANNAADVLLLDIGDAVLRLADNDFKAVLCRSPQG